MFVYVAGFSHQAGRDGFPLNELEVGGLQSVTATPKSWSCMFYVLNFNGSFFLSIGRKFR